MFDMCFSQRQPPVLNRYDYVLNPLRKAKAPLQALLRSTNLEGNYCR